jgi:hypothetical protein
MLRLPAIRQLVCHRRSVAEDPRRTSAGLFGSDGHRIAGNLKSAGQPQDRRSSSVPTLFASTKAPGAVAVRAIARPA